MGRFGLAFFLGDVINGVSFSFFVSGYLTQGPKPLGVILCLFFKNEARLKSAFLSP